MDKIEVTQADIDCAEQVHACKSHIFAAGIVARHRLSHTPQSVEPVAWMPREIEKDNKGRTLICTGCGTVETVRSIRANHATAFTCCPERKMVKAAPATDVAALVEAAKAILHAVCHETGFAAAVRADSGLAYPWEALDIAEAQLIAALAPFTEGQDDA